MNDIDLQIALNEFELRMLDGSDVTVARAALRHLLFTLADVPLEGSVADAIKVLSEQTRPCEGAASVVLRALANEDLVRANAGNQLARSAVTLAEKGLPGLCSLLGLSPRKQTFENYELLLKAESWIERQLRPLLTPCTTLESMLASRNAILSSLSHGRLIEFGGIYHLPEIKDVIEAVFASLETVSRISETFAVDVGTCERLITDAQRFITDYHSFITKIYLSPWLQCALARLQEFIVSLRGRFTAVIVQEWSDTGLLKRYPLLEADRDMRIVVPFSNSGRGAATDVRVSVVNTSQDLLFLNDFIELGGVSPGRFSVALDAHVVQPCQVTHALLEVEWGEVGTALRQSIVFELRILAQSSEIDWDAQIYADPYGTGPAEGAAFVGRQEQVQILVARMLRKPMEPSYITGQKRVGKTSLATAAADQAHIRDPKGKIAWHYILWGQIAHESPHISLQQLGEQIEDFIIRELSSNVPIPKGSYVGSLSPLIKLSALAKTIDPDRRFIIIIDEFDEMPQELYLQGNLADTVFGNLRAITATSNLCLLLVGGENMPFVMDRQGQKLNKFSRVNLTYFDRSTEWDDFHKLVREPAIGFLEWHQDAIKEVYDLTNGNPYFSKIVCSKVFARSLRERDIDVTKSPSRIGSSTCQPS